MAECEGQVPSSTVRISSDQQSEGTETDADDGDEEGDESQTGSDPGDIDLEEHMQRILAEAEAQLTAHVHKRSKARRAMKREALRAEAQKRKEMSTPPLQNIQEPDVAQVAPQTPPNSMRSEEMSPGTKFEIEVSELEERQQTAQKLKRLQILRELNVSFCINGIISGISFYDKILNANITEWKKL